MIVLMTVLFCLGAYGLFSYATSPDFSSAVDLEAKYRALLAAREVPLYCCRAQAWRRAARFLILAS